MSMSDDALLIKPKKFSICPRGHVVEAASFPVVAFTAHGAIEAQQVVCSRCQYEFFAGNFPAVILPESTSRETAHAEAFQMRVMTLWSEAGNKEKPKLYAIIDDEEGRTFEWLGDTMGWVARAKEKTS